MQRGGTSILEETRAFAAAGDTVGVYYQELGRLLSELCAAGGAASEDRQDLDSLCAEKLPETLKQLTAESNRWADGWAVFRVPGHTAWPGQSAVPLSSLLREPLRDPRPDPTQPAWQPADLPAWSGLTYGDLLGLQASLPGSAPAAWACGHGAKL